MITMISHDPAMMQPNTSCPAVPSYGVGVNFNLSISLKTKSCSGLLAYIASAAVSDFLALELYNGNVRTHFKVHHFVFNL